MKFTYYTIIGKDKNLLERSQRWLELHWESSIVLMDARAHEKEGLGKIRSDAAYGAGDVIIHDSLQRAGYQSYLLKDVITYHFVRGESKHSA